MIQRLKGKKVNLRAENKKCLSRELSTKKKRRIQKYAINDEGSSEEEKSTVGINEEDMPKKTNLTAKV